jgi:hypothetical protein
MKVDAQDHKVSLVYGQLQSTQSPGLQQPLLPKSACMKQAPSVQFKLWRSSLSASVS